MSETSKIKKYIDKKSFEKEMEKKRFNLFLTGILKKVIDGYWHVMASESYTEEVAFPLTPQNETLKQKVRVYMDHTGEQVVIFDLKNLIAYSQVFS